MSVQEQECDNQARVLEMAVTKHVGFVRDYIQMSIRRLRSYRPVAQERETPRFLSSAYSLLMSLENMLLNSRNIKAMDQLNHEQLEAKMQWMRKQVELVREGTLPVL